MPTQSRTGHAVTAIGFLVVMIDGFDTLMLAFIAPLIVKEWALTPATMGAIFACSYAGAALGASAIGIAADRFGRRRMLLTSLAFAGVLTMLCATASSPRQLLLLRAAAGLGLGGAIPTMTALTAASAPTVLRTGYVTRMFLGFPFGAIVGGSLTAHLMTSVGWRGILAGGGIAALMVIPLVAWNIGKDSNNIPSTLRIDSGPALAGLLADGRGRSTLLFCAAVFLMLLTGYFLVSWTPTVLTLNGMDPQSAAMTAVVLTSGGLLGALILSFVKGRRNPMAAVAGCLIVGALLIAMLGHAALLTGAMALPMVFAVGMLILGAQGSIPALCVDLYPAAACATGVGLSVTIGRLGSIIGPLVGGYLIAARLDWDVLFQVAALPSLAASISLLILLVTRAK